MSPQAAAAAAATSAAQVPNDTLPTVEEVYKLSGTKARFVKRELDELVPEVNQAARKMIFNLQASNTQNVQLAVSMMITSTGGAADVNRIQQLAAKIAECASADLPFFVQSGTINVETNGGLREIQRNQFKEMQELWDEHSLARLLSVVCTGGGKSGIIALAPYAAHANRVLVISPSPLIHSQLVDDLDATRETSFLRMTNTLPLNSAGTHVKVFDANRAIKENKLSDEDLIRNMREANITVVTQQMLRAGSDKTGNAFHRVHAIANSPRDPVTGSPLFDLIILDEAHHTPAPTWHKMLDILPRAKTLGLTATPFRTDKQTPPHDDKLTPFNLLDANEAKPAVAKNVTYLEVTPEHVLQANGMAEPPDSPGRITLSDEAILDVMFTVLTILSKKRALNGVPHRALVCASSHVDCERIVELCNSIQYPLPNADRKMRAAVLKGKTEATSDADRKSVLEGLEGFDISAKDAVDIVVQCEALSEGYDNPLLSVGVMLKPTQSLAYFAQSFAGRSVRMLDHTNNGLSAAQNKMKGGFDDANNTCHLVTHWLLRQRELWTQFCANQQPGSIVAPLEDADIDAAMDDDESPDSGGAAGGGAQLQQTTLGADGSGQLIATLPKRGSSRKFFLYRDVLHRTKEHMADVLARDDEYLTPFDAASGHNSMDGYKVLTDQKAGYDPQTPPGGNPRPSKRHKAAATASGGASGGA